MVQLVGTEHVAVQTASGSAVTDVAANARALALLAGAVPARVNTPIATAGNGVLTAAALIGSVITRSGASANFTDTTDSAQNIIATLPAEAPVNYGWIAYIRNTTPFAETVAGGVGVAVSGENVIPANSTGFFLVTVTGTANVSMVGFCSTPTDLGIVEVNTAITTAGAGTLSAAGIAGGVITRSGPTVAFSDATDTGPNIIAALPNPQLGQSWEASVINTTAFAQTLTNGAGVTLSGLASPIPGNSTGRFLCTYSAAGQVTMQLISVAYNAAGGRDPSNKQTQFGGGTGTFRTEGLVYSEFDSAAVNPGSTANDNVLSVFTLPAGTFDQAARGVSIKAKGSFGATGNNKRIKIVFNPTAAVVGSAVTGGTVIADTGVVATNAGGWVIGGEVFKYGGSGSNTQMGSGDATIGGSAVQPTAPQLLTATESGAILVAIVGNATTATSDIGLSQVTARASN